LLVDKKYVVVERILKFFTVGAFNGVVAVLNWKLKAYVKRFFPVSQTGVYSLCCCLQWRSERERGTLRPGRRFPARATKYWKVNVKLSQEAFCADIMHQIQF